MCGQNGLVASEAHPDDWKFCDAFLPIAANHTFAGDPRLRADGKKDGGTLTGWISTSGYNDIVALEGGFKKPLRPRVLLVHLELEILDPREIREPVFVAGVVDSIGKPERGPDKTMAAQADRGIVQPVKIPKAI